MIFRSRYSVGKVSRVSRRTVGARHQARRERQQVFQRIFKKLFFFGSIVFLIGVVSFSILAFFISRQLPPVESISTYIPAETTKIISADGVVLGELHREENRVLIPIENISPILQKTVVAVEDSNFYNHHGIDIKGIVRALYKDIQAGAFVQGGSTLTQQLARNVFLQRRKKITRKIAEAILAIQIERKYTKTEILEMYLNQVYWGHNAYGIQSASRLYYGKSAADLNLAESAMLVGLLTGPELYSPLKSMTRAKNRQRIVLNSMADQGFITPQQASAAYNTEIVLNERKKFRYKAPFFMAHIVKQLIEMYGEEATYTSGMKVYTTLDYSLQKKADEVVKKWVEYGEKTKRKTDGVVATLNYHEGAILALDPRNGFIKVMQGGVEFQENQFNRTTQALRQPGSAFKPFVYLTALDKGFSPGTIIEDAPVTFNTPEGPYAPQNYTQKYLGPLPMRKALERSVNIVAIKLNYLMGPQETVNTAKKLGITSDLLPVMSLPLGANVLTMLELTSAYGVLANQGWRVEPTSIVKIEDRDGNPLYEHKVKEKQVYDGNLISALVEMMKGVVNYGTGRNARLPRPIAGKTGTTSDYRDAWFVGFVPQLVCAAWVGNDDNSPTNKITGGWIPAIMWKEFMKEALATIPPQDFPRPSGLVTRKVNWKTGKLATQFSPKEYVTVEKYWRGKEPTETDEGSTVESPLENKDDKSFLDFFEG